MNKQADREFDWVAALALGLSTAVIVPSMVAVTAALITTVAALMP